MKLTLLLLCSVGGFSSLFAQTNVNPTTVQQTNGVVVHQAIGNEGVVAPAQTAMKIRTIEDWNLAECIEALQVIDLKCQQISFEECQRYVEERASIEKRKQSLIEANK